MKPKAFWNKLGTATGAALVGAICGTLLAAWGNSVSSSPVGVTAVIVLAAGLGALTRRIAGVLLGGICGSLLASFGSLVGGTPLGVVLTITGCALLAAWLKWIHDSRMEAPEAPPDDFRHRVIRSGQWSFFSKRIKEHVA
jgi:hypothetical protein